MRMVLKGKVYIKLPVSYIQFKIHSKTLSAEIKVKTLNLRKYTLHNFKHIIKKFSENALKMPIYLLHHKLELSCFANLSSFLQSYCKNLSPELRI